jgi:hypothetical protein
MKRRLLGALTLAAMSAALAVATQSAVLKAGACGDSGAYTDRLCAGERLNTSEYLISRNGRYRFYYQDDGHTLIYDTIDPNNWDPSASMFEPHGNASYLKYGVDSSGSTTSQLTMWSFDSSGEPALSYYIHWGDAQSSGHYVKLEDDGCLRAYEADRSRIMTLWC